MSPDCVVGIDIGTTSVRVSFYDADGNLITEGRVPNVVSPLHPGWVKQDYERRG